MFKSSSSSSLSGKATPQPSSGKSTPYSVSAATPNPYHANGMYYWFKDYLKTPYGSPSLLDATLTTKILATQHKSSGSTLEHPGGLNYYMIHISSINETVYPSNFGISDSGEDLALKDHHISIYEEVNSSLDRAGLHYTLDAKLSKACASDKGFLFPKGDYKAHTYFMLDGQVMNTTGFFFPSSGPNITQAIEADIQPILLTGDGGDVCQTLIEKFNEESERLLGEISHLIGQAQTQEALSISISLSDSPKVAAHILLMNGYIQTLEPLMEKAQRWQLPTSCKSKAMSTLKSQLTFFTNNSATGTPLKSHYNGANLTPYSVTGLVSPNQPALFTGAGAFGMLKRENSDSGCSDEGGDTFDLNQEATLKCWSSESAGPSTPYAKAGSPSKSPFGKGKKGGSPSFWKGASPSFGKGMSASSPIMTPPKTPQKAGSSPDLNKVAKILDEVSRFEERLRSTKSNSSMTPAHNLRCYCERELVEPYRKLEQGAKGFFVEESMMELIETGKSQILEHLMRKIYSQNEPAFRESEILRGFMKAQFPDLGKVALRTCEPLELYAFMGFYWEVLEAAPDKISEASSNIEDLLAYAMTIDSRNFAPLSLISQSFHKTLEQESLRDLYPSLALAGEASTLPNCLFVSQCLGIVEGEFPKESASSWQESYRVLANYIGIWKAYQGVLKEVLEGQDLLTLLDSDDRELMDGLRELLAQALALRDRNETLSVNVASTVGKLRTLGEVHESYRESPLLETYSESAKELSGKISAWNKVTTYLQDDGAGKKLNHKLKSISELCERHAELAQMISMKKSGQEIPQDLLEYFTGLQESEQQKSTEVLQALLFFQLFFEKRPDSQSIGALKTLRTTIADLQKESGVAFEPMSYFLSWLLSPKEKLSSRIETPTPYALIHSHRRDLTEVLSETHRALQGCCTPINLSLIHPKSGKVASESSQDSFESNEVSAIFSGAEIMMPSPIASSPRSPKSRSPQPQSTAYSALIFSTVRSAMDEEISVVSDPVRASQSLETEPFEGISGCFLG